MKTIMERFLNKTSKTRSGCWMWTGSKRPHGYGLIRVGREVVSAHRVAYEMFIGQIPKGLCCLHHCDQPSCVRPSHLFLGTQVDNIRDRVRKGRSAIGKRSGKYKHGLLCINTPPEARRKYYREYYEKNREKNREALLEYQRTYRRKNRVAINARKRVRRQLERERL